MKQEKHKSYRRCGTFPDPEKPSYQLDPDDDTEEGGFSGSLVALNWNCCRLGNPATVQRLWEIQKRNSPDICFLMETKNDLEMIENNLHWLPLDNFHEVPPNSPRSGGLFPTWKNDIQLTIKGSNKNFIDTLITEKGITFQMTFVYGEQDHTKRLAIWNELSTLHPPSGKPWLLTGDFNEITDNSEKKEEVREQRVHYAHSEPSYQKMSSLMLNTMEIFSPEEARGTHIWYNAAWTDP